MIPQAQTQNEYISTCKNIFVIRSEIHDFLFRSFIYYSSECGVFAAQDLINFLNDEKNGVEHR